MTQVGNILIATDFSETATNALVYAVQMAEQTGQDIIVLYVHKEDENDGEIRNRFEKLEHDFVYGRGITCTFDTRTGSLMQAVSDCVNEYDIELVIVGTRGFEGFQELETGSITAALMDHPAIPVISIPKHCNKLEFNHLVLASDFNESKPAKPLRMVYELASVCDSDLKIVYVDQDSRLDHAPEARNKLEEIFSLVPHTYHILKNKDITQGLLNFCETEEVDLLITLRRKHKDLEKLLSGSISKQLSLRGKVPLMVIPVMDS